MLSFRSSQLMAATIQRIMSAYFGSINIGAFLAIASSFAEKVWHRPTGLP